MYENNDVKVGTLNQVGRGLVGEAIKRVPLIEREVNELKEANKALSEAISHLENRLSPVLRGELNEKCDGDEPVQSLPLLGEVIRAERINVLNSNARIASLLERLEL